MSSTTQLARLVGCAAFAASTTVALAAVAEPPPAVDVVLQDPPPPRRILALEWNPLPLITIGKLSANVIVAPIDHHALVLSPFYAWTTTVPIYAFDDSGNATQLPAQKLSGFGCEIGYRYYGSVGGPRGFFFGPSLIVASFEATASDGTKTPFADYGLAADAGYQALVADRVSLSLGAGVQYLGTSKPIPEQQLPAQVYANGGVRPRLLMSMGWAF